MIHIISHNQYMYNPDQYMYNPDQSIYNHDVLGSPNMTDIPERIETLESVVKSVVKIQQKYLDIKFIFLYNYHIN
jgi:hypothetical protein